ncbi:MAG TPA: hypothetical protein VNI84_16240 [Pyrinomonadaceae bacterium]|nr:hypothetical protein [Pyrinomonadaceae bacterium]
MFIDNEKGNYPVKKLCRVMEVSVSGYYALRQAINKAAINEAETSGGFNQGLLLGESQAVWFEKNPGGFGKIRSRGRQISSALNNARTTLKGDAAA